MTEMWKPTRFECEMMEMQPECDLVFEQLGRNAITLAPFNIEKELDCLYSSNEQRQFPDDTKNKTVAIISKIQDLLPDRKILGRPLTEEDIDDVDRERETLAMIRSIGIAPSVDSRLDSKKTLPKITQDIPYKISNGRTLLFSEEYFKLQPRVKSCDNSETLSDEEANAVDGNHLDLDGYEDSNEDNSFENKPFKKNKRKPITVAERLLAKNSPTTSKDSEKVTDVPQSLTFNKNFYLPKVMYDKKRQSSNPNL